MYQRKDDIVTLTMTFEEYESLLTSVGYALSAAKQMGDQYFFRSWIQLVNSLNEGHPHFQPYEVPKA